MKLFSALLLGTSLCLVACNTTDPVVSPTDVTIAKTESLSKGMVASANPLATQAGVNILKAGGSAVDAAIAVQTVLGLVEPQSSGIGGGAFMVVYDPKTAQVWNYNGREAAPTTFTSTSFQDKDGKPIRRFDGIASGQSTGAPGAMVMLNLAHQDYGTMAWGPQFEPAIKHAEDGFAVSPRMASLVERMGKYVLNRQEATREYFFLEDGTTPIPVGFIRDNQPYATSLRALQDNPRALLEGPIAEQIIAATREEPRPGTMTLADMAAYQPQKSPALCSTYRDHFVCGAQPPASGGVAVQSILRTLEHFDMAALGQSADGWHAFSEASFLAYSDRDKYVGDPDFVDVPVKAMLDKDYIASRAKLITMESAMNEVKAGNPVDFLRGMDDTPDNPGTSHFTVVDKDGLVVSMTTTVEAPFGSQRMAAGFVLNNQLTDFSFSSVDADGNPLANAPAAGKRPRSSMSPHIVFNKDGEFLFSTGSPGGNSIIAYTAKSIVGILDWGLTPQEAIDLPNLIARNGKIRLEENRMDEAIIVDLEARGHEIIRSQGEISGLHIIYRNPDGSLVGGADPRREGTAVGLD